MSLTIPKQSCTVKGYQMAYVEQAGNDGPIIFLHGNPTSSFLWRNILPQVAASSGRRAVAPDLIGMGDSDKLTNSGPDRYTFAEHAEFLDTLLESCVLDDHKVILVVHDWGSALGFWWAYRHQDHVQGIVYMEAITKSFSFAGFGNNTAIEEFMRNLRTPGVGESMILEQNIFVEQLLPSSILRNLTDEEMDAYRAPYLEEGESRRPTLTWPRELPLDGTTESKDMQRIMDTYGKWMAENDLPKLFVNANPGTLTVGNLRDFARTWKNQTK